MKASTCGGMSISWGVEHRDGKKHLISRQVNVDPPKFCGLLRYLPRYALLVARYVLLRSYHENRVLYAEKHRSRNIRMKYRTGEDAPDSIPKLLKETIKLRFLRR